MLHDRLQPIVARLGRMPTNSYLREIGENRIACQISRRGGWAHWAKLLNTTLTPSDTVSGWAGEARCTSWLESLGYDVEQQTTRAPFDLLVGGCLRIDVKAASYAQYRPSTGWFYRLGRVMTADLVVCVRMDRDDFYAFPWFRVPSTNLTITPTGTAHTFYRENASNVLRMMYEIRISELERLPECSSPHADARRRVCA